MDIDLARYVVRAAFRSSGAIADLVPFLKEHLGPEEYRPYALAIASGVAAIQLDLLNKLFAEHPGLEAEVEASIQKYGRYL